MEGRGGEESKPKIHSKPTTSKRRRICMCMATTLLILILLIIIITILAFTVYKPKRPVITVSSLSLDDFHFDFAFPLKFNLNLTLAVDLSVKNPNKVAFRYTNASALLKFKDKVIGDVPIPAGKIKASGSTAMNLRITVMGDKVLGDSDVYSNVFKNGTLPVSAFTKIKGSVRILHLFDIHLVSYSTCDVLISITSRSIQDQKCEYEADL